MRWLAAPVVISAAYQALVLVSSIARMIGPRKRSAYSPPVSILKPVHGGEPQFYDALASHARQEYPEFEILFGVRDPQDPALPYIHRLSREFPNVPMRIVTEIENTPNGKVGALAALAAAAKYPVLLVNDSDIRVDRGYMRNVVAPLANPCNGLVTCLYRARADSFPAQCEALGIATDFAPSVLVARLLGVAEFALGSTMVVRAEDLRRIGGFKCLADYLADDYQLGLRLTQLGLRVVFADAVVETHLGSGSWRDVWKHQIRWSRTIRVSRRGGYYGYIATQTTLWAVVALLAGAPYASLTAMVLRLFAGLAAGAGVLQDPLVPRYWWLMPARDLFGFAVWLAGVAGTTVEWRGEKLQLLQDGRIRRTGRKNQTGKRRSELMA